MSLVRPECSASPQAASVDDQTGAAAPGRLVVRYLLAGDCLM